MVIDLPRPVEGRSKARFGEHALERMQERGITVERVLWVLDHPTEQGLPTQRPHRRRVRRGKIEVVYDLEIEAVSVVTAFHYEG